MSRCSRSAAVIATGSSSLDTSHPIRNPSVVNSTISAPANGASPLDPNSGATLPNSRPAARPMARNCVRPTATRILVSQSEIC
jgi:hypothetical protein